MVTGGGKTFFALMCMLAFRERYPNGRFVIVVPTTALLDQWYVSLQEDLHISENEIASFSGQEKSSKPSTVNLLVINTARTLADQLANISNTCLIVDECHRAGSPVNALALSGKHQATLGLSATPIREYDDGFQKHLVPSLGKIIYTYSYSDAYQDNVVVPFDLINAHIPLLPDEQEQYDQLTRRVAVEIGLVKKGEGSQEKLERLLQRRASVSARAAMRVPSAVKLAELHKGERTIIFHESIEATNKILRILTLRQLSATIYHSKIGPTVRRDNLRLFRKGVFDVLLTCRALDEGLNIPETSIAIIASSTASKRQRIQRLGRVLRPSKDKSTARVYTVYATSQEEQRLIKEAKRLEGVAEISWMRLTRQDNVTNSS